MGWYYNLYTPDLKQREESDYRFVACDKFFDGDRLKTLPFIGCYEQGLTVKKYLPFDRGIYILNEDICKEADEISESTFFTDFLKKYDCNGMLIKVS